MLTAEELTPSCGLGLLCASNFTACAAKVMARQSRPGTRRVVWALVIGAHEWSWGYYYREANTAIYRDV